MRFFPQRRDEHDWIGWQFQTKGASKGYVVLLRLPIPPIAPRMSACTDWIRMRCSLVPLPGFSGEKHGTGRELERTVVRHAVRPGKHQVWGYEKSL